MSHSLGMGRQLQHYMFKIEWVFCKGHKNTLLAAHVLSFREQISFQTNLGWMKQIVEKFKY